jgi:hypothetical protein
MAKASFTVLRDYPKLLVLPVLAAAALILALAVLFGIFMFEAGSFEGAGRLVKNLEVAFDKNKIALGAGVVALGWVFTSLSLYFNACSAACWTSRGRRSPTSCCRCSSSRASAPSAR